MRTHLVNGATVRVAVARGLRDRSCSLCSNGVRVGVSAHAPDTLQTFVFCRSCSRAIGRAADALTSRKDAPS